MSLVLMLFPLEQVCIHTKCLVIVHSPLEFMDSLSARNYMYVCVPLYTNVISI